jgi:hypothetical protein
VEWARTYGGTSNEYAWGVFQVNGGYVIAGYSSSFGAGEKDFWIVKTKNDGSCGPLGAETSASVSNVDGYAGAQTPSPVVNTPSTTVTETNAIVTDTDATIQQQAP